MAKQIEQTLERYRRMFDLGGKTALVLGAASGIGKASAEALAALGAAVICADIDQAGVEATAAAIGGKAHRIDAGSSEEVRALAAAVEAEHARIDIALTTPATHVRKLLCDYTDEEYDRVANLNLRGTFYFLREFGTLMASQGGGSLIASSSVRASTLEPGLAIYGATKAGIIQMVRGLACELGPRACASMPSCPASWRRRSSRRSRRARRSFRRSPRTRCSIAGASRAKLPPRSRSWLPTRRAMSPAARFWSTAAGPPSTARRPG